MSGNHLRGVAMAAAGMLIISPDGLLLRLITETGPWEVVFYRTALMGLALAAFHVLRYRRRARAVWRDIGGAGVLSGLLIGASNILFVLAMLNTSVANTLVIVAAMPLFAAVAGWALIRERTGGRTWAAIAVAFSGIVLIFQSSLGGGGLFGDVCAAACALLMALNLVVIRKSGDKDMTPALALGGLFAAAAVLPWADPFAVTAPDLVVLAALGLLILPVSLALFLGGARYVAAAEVALLALIETVLGPVWAWWGVGEVPSWQTVIGGGVVLGAIVWHSFGALARRSSVAPHVVEKSE